MNRNRFAAFFAILAAALYALSAPLSKLFLQDVAPTVMASLLYLGAGLGMMLLSLEDAESLRFSVGSIFVLLACCCWGLENNCTRMLSYSDPQQIVVIKGLGSGAGSMLVAMLTGAPMPSASRVFPVLLLGFVAYGLSITFYIYAQRDLGAARTNAYYAVQPFISVLLSLVFFRELPGAIFFIALALMAVGTRLVAMDQQGA